VHKMHKLPAQLLQPIRRLFAYNPTNSDTFRHIFYFLALLRPTCKESGPSGGKKLVHKVHKVPSAPSPQTVAHALLRAASPLLATLRSPRANKQLTPQLASFRQKTTHRVLPGRLFFRAQSAQIGKLWRSQSRLLGEILLANPHYKQTTYPKLASFRQKTPHRPQPSRLFFSCTKCTK